MQLGALTLGTRPCIIVAITDRDLDDTRWAVRADAIELRVDQCTQRDPASVRAIVDRARALRLPILATVRSADEGGHGGLDDAARLALYTALLPAVDGIDVELSSAICEAVVADARRHGRLAIVSRHHFDATPDAATLAATLADGARGGDVVKIAAAAHDAGDLARLLDCLRAPGPPRIVIAMGAEGAASRVFFPLVGSLLTYSFAGAPTAPGQLALDELDAALRRYSPAYAAARVDRPGGAY